MEWNDFVNILDFHQRQENWSSEVDDQEQRKADTPSGANVYHA
jgi:hypothetical protein